MNKSINTSDIANLAVLNFNNLTDRTSNFKIRTFEVCRRFIHSSKLLSEQGFFGIQIETNRAMEIGGNLFSDSADNISFEDYKWIFDDYKGIEINPSGELKDLFEGGRRVYVFSANPGFEPNDEVNREDFLKKYYEDLPLMFAQNEAIVRILTGPSVGEYYRNGLIFLSLNTGMSLRLRTILSFIFPHNWLKEIKSFDDMNETNFFVSDYYIGALMSIFMEKLLSANCKIDLDKSLFEDEEEFEFDDDYFTSIEDLELSVRAYNCLKRAGINTIGELKKMSDEELRRVRNLGQRSYEEVRERLAEMENRTEVKVLNEKNYMEMLDELVGLENVKKQIKKIAAFARMKKEMTDEGRDLSVVLNMEFVGNPGTAKTTVARILAGIYSEIGITKSNELIEVGRAELIAKYEGQTADKVKNVFRKAKGKTLFIDEAYSLVEAENGTFGDEAIATIVQEMENNREDTIVIFAGYPKKMEELFDKNVGLRSRVPFKIDFEDYTAEEMVKIVELEVEKRGFSLFEQAKTRIMDVCKEAVSDPDAGNGRFCRNLVENAILDYAARVYGEDTTEVDGNGNEKNFVLLSQDFSDTSAIFERKRGFAIGFDIKAS